MALKVLEEIHIIHIADAQKISGVFYGFEYQLDEILHVGNAVLRPCCADFGAGGY